MPPLDPDPRVRKRWRKLLFEAINLYPEDLQDVSRLLATMPVTQVSVERLFSALKLLKSDLRNNLKVNVIGIRVAAKTKFLRYRGSDFKIKLNFKILPGSGSVYARFVDLDAYPLFGSTFLLKKIICCEKNEPVIITPKLNFTATRNWESFEK